MEEILIVDDERDNLKIFKHLLESEGITVLCVTSGEEALEKIMKTPFLLMITDLNMPGLDGFELTRKALEIAPHLPIIMSTGDLSPEILRMAAEAGIIKVFAKPFEPMEMIETVRMGMRKIRGMGLFT